MFLGELLRGLWRKNVRDLEVLRPEVDNGGYDLALVFRGLTRHVQLKSSYRGARCADVTASVKLLGRPSACIVWIFFDPDTLSLGPFFWFGGAPGERMPPLGEAVARHTKPNGRLKKADRPAHRAKTLRSLICLNLLRRRRLALSQSCLLAIWNQS